MKFAELLIAIGVAILISTSISALVDYFTRDGSKITVECYDSNGKLVFTDRVYKFGVNSGRNGPYKKCVLTQTE